MNFDGPTAKPCVMWLYVTMQFDCLFLNFKSLIGDSFYSFQVLLCLGYHFVYLRVCNMKILFLFDMTHYRLQYPDGATHLLLCSRDVNAVVHLMDFCGDLKLQDLSLPLLGARGTARQYIYVKVC